MIKKPIIYMFKHLVAPSPVGIGKGTGGRKLLDAKIGKLAFQKQQALAQPIKRTGFTYYTVKHKEKLLIGGHGFIIAIRTMFSNTGTDNSLGKKAVGK